MPDDCSESERRCFFNSDASPCDSRVARASPCDSVAQQPLDGARSVVEAGLELPDAPVERQPGENDLPGLGAADSEPRHRWAPDYRLSQQKIFFEAKTAKENYKNPPAGPELYLFLSKKS